FRFTGGLGIALSCPSAGRPPLRRTYEDLDAVVPNGQAKDALELLGALGYQEDDQFNAVHGGERLIVFDPASGRRLDLFYERIQLCHRIDLRDRLGFGGPALDPADLLLMKLQVVETNRKDLTDICAIASDHAFDVDYLCGLTAGDWGLWRTT